jgi:hypothetical protein
MKAWQRKLERMRTADWFLAFSTVAAGVVTFLLSNRHKEKVFRGLRPEPVVNRRGLQLWTSAEIALIVIFFNLSRGPEWLVICVIVTYFLLALGVPAYLGFSAGARQTQLIGLVRSVAPVTLFLFVGGAILFGFASGLVRLALGFD